MRQRRLQDRFSRKPMLGKSSWQMFYLNARRFQF
jgi:hypothetical protein